MSLKDYTVLIFMLWNAFVFITYGIDKQKAKSGYWRIPEKTLLWESLLLGGIGAFLGGKLFHHKTLKWYFKASWYLGIIVDIAFVYWFLAVWH